MGTPLAGSIPSTGDFIFYDDDCGASQASLLNQVQSMKPEGVKRLRMRAQGSEATQNANEKHKA